jgi:hypothetical protein
MLATRAIKAWAYDCPEHNTMNWRIADAPANFTHPANEPNSSSHCICGKQEEG